ncbi:unnamed protein product [Sympodiomycopsis kandeliae]
MAAKTTMGNLVLPWLREKFGRAASSSPPFPSSSSSPSSSSLSSVEAWSASIPVNLRLDRLREPHGLPGLDYSMFGPQGMQVLKTLADGLPLSGLVSSGLLRRSASTSGSSAQHRVVFNIREATVNTAAYKEFLDGRSIHSASHVTMSSTTTVRYAGMTIDGTGLSRHEDDAATSGQSEGSVLTAFLNMFKDSIT